MNKISGRQGTAKDSWFDIVEDDVKFYKTLFPSATPIVYDPNSEHPLKQRFDELYGKALFLIYRPLGTMAFMKDDGYKQPFFLLLVRNSYTFEKYAEYFFNGSLGRDFFLRANKVECFGNVKLLMLDEDKKKRYSEYRNAIALAFKSGKNPVADSRRTVSYLYRDGKLIETPEFLAWDENIEKEF